MYAGYRFERVLAASSRDRVRFRRKRRGVSRARTEQVIFRVPTPPLSVGGAWYVTRSNESSSVEQRRGSRGQITRGSSATSSRYVVDPSSCQRGRERARAGSQLAGSHVVRIPGLWSLRDRFAVGIRDSYSSAYSVPTMIPSQAFPSLFVPPPPPPPSPFSAAALGLLAPA